MNIHAIYRIFQGYFRPRRIRVLKKMLPMLDQDSTTVLDVGGSAYWWADVAPRSTNITIVNVDDSMREVCERAGHAFLVADGRCLPFKELEFDLVLSNSVIEHVGNFEDQMRFARELGRCGKTVYVQTPNKWFPVEPHLIAMFLHWLPRSIERRLVRWFSIWGLVTKPDQNRVDAALGETRLLTAREMNQLFPGWIRQDERFLGLTKSFVAVRSFEFGARRGVDQAASNSGSGIPR